MSYEEMYTLVKTYKQEQLLRYYEELNDIEKEQLLQQISLIDFTLFKLLDNYLIAKRTYQSGIASNTNQRGKFSPISTLTAEQIENKKDIYYQTGTNAILAGKVGAVLLAGGQGSRFGLDKPKGTLNVGITKALYLFELHIHNLLETVKNSGAWIPLFIMTSAKNNSDTKEFFKQHNYFGYHKDYISFFTQEMAPSVDFNGKIIMEGKGTISMSPNGNGGWFISLSKAGILRRIKENNIEWLNVFSVDNALQKLADPYFIGATINSNCVSGAKVVSKSSPEERVGLICLEDGKPSIVEYYEMPDYMANSRDYKGELIYKYGVILNYLFKVNALENMMNDSLPYHIVQRKIPYMDEQGTLVKPDSPNGYKFETLVLDMIHRLDNCLPFEVLRNIEFAPIKNKTGEDSLETARELLIYNGVIL